MNKKLVKSQVQTKVKIENICTWLAEKKAKDITAFDLEGKSAIAEGLIVVTATSLRQAQGLADFALEQARGQNYEFMHMEGYQSGLWILLDFNDVLLNILQQEPRDLYRLEELHPNATILRDDRLK